MTKIKGLGKRKSRAELIKEIKKTNKTIKSLSSRASVLETGLAQLRSFLEGNLLLPPSGDRTDLSTEKEVILIDDSDSDDIEEAVEHNENSSDINYLAPVEDVDEDEENELAAVAIRSTDSTTEWAVDTTSYDNVEPSDIVMDHHSDSPSESELSVSGTSRSIPTVTVWNHFGQKVLMTNGRRTVVMVCKYCKEEVTANIDFLKKHLTDCNQLSAEEQVRVNMDNITDSIVQSHSNNSSLNVYDEDPRTKTRGRRCCDTWDHFSRFVTPTPVGTRRKVTAICKRCGQQVSSKVSRMKVHLIEKCTARSLFRAYQPSTK